MKPSADELLTTAEVADLAGVSRQTVWRWAAEGTLAAAITLPSGHRRFRRSDVETLLAPKAAS